MTTRRKLTIGLAAVAVAAAVGWYLADTVDSAALVDLDAGSFEQFRDQFNEAAGQVRVVVLLSPT
jgi:hypothetical protein